MKFNDLKAEQVEAAANMMKAVAHPMRLAILRQLSSGEEMNVTEIHLKINIGQSAASHHLGILKARGILGSRRDGKNTFYSIKNPNIYTLLECISNCAC